MSYIEFRDVRKIYGQGEAEIRALNGASFTIEKGEFCVIVGQSGAGKTTILNILGGMEIRSRFFKGCHGVKAPTVVSVEKTKRTSCCCVFEGFMDFLSYQTLLERYEDRVINPVHRDCIILNSTSMVQKALPFIQVYDLAFTYLDNDVAGQRACDYIDASMVGRTIKMSGQFSNYNDLNDYLMNKLK